MRRAVTAFAALGAALVLAPAALANTYHVTSGADTGGTCPPASCTLRQAITTANADPGPDAIVFDSPVAVTLGSALPAITPESVSIDGGGSSVSGGGTVGPLLDVLVSNVAITGLTLRSSSSDGVRVDPSASNVVVSRSPIYDVAGKPIDLVSGANGGIQAPANLRVGPRQANGTLPITGSTGPGGTLELYRGDPATSDAFWFDATVGGGAFSLVPPAEPAPGEKVSATITAGGTSEWATTTVPSDVVSPWIAGAVAISYNEIRVQPSEPVDPASIQPSDFFVHMASVDRPIAGASASPDGSSITLYSPKPWGPGDAGMVHLTAPGAIADSSGNVSLTTNDVHVGGAPGDFIAPVVTSLRLSPPTRLCLYAKPRCRRTGAAIIFRSSEDGFTWVTVAKGTRVIGTRKYLAQPGDNYIRFDGKIRGRRLLPGRYRMYVGVQDIVGNLTAGNQQPSVAFTVVKPKKPRRRR